MDPTKLRQIPKVELHAHLNGCIPLDLLRELAEERSVSLSAKYFDNGSKLRSLADCFDLFAELPQVINDLRALRRITQATLEFFAQHHVVYLELRSTPKRLWKDFRNQQEEAATKMDYIRTILETISIFNQKEEERYNNDLDDKEKSCDATSTRLPLVCRFIVSIDRAASLKEATENVEVAVAFQSTGLVVGLDLGGNPMKQSFSLFEPLFSQARNDHGLKCTIHCAEVENDEYKDILKFRPDRLGHAVLMPRDAFVNLNIPVETCPTSNLLTLELNHHTTTLQTMNMKQWIVEDYPFVVCTDDPGIFHTNPTQELQLIKYAFDTAFDVEHVMLRCIHYGFAETKLLELIGTRMKKSFDAVMCTQC